MPLARFVPADYPLYGLQARGFDGTSPLPGSLSDMAADYLEQIRSVQPSGPYHLLGWSFGGIVAHEIAVQLQAAGEEVAALIVMDTYPPAPRSGSAPVITDRDEPGPELPVSEPADMVDRIRREHAGDLAGFSEQELTTYARIFVNNAEIMQDHEFHGFAGDVLLIVADQERPTDQSAAATARWVPFVSGEIAERRLPCTHAEMSQPAMLAQAWAAVSRWLNLDR
jgi:thioesterase domain-containing protein